TEMIERQPYLPRFMAGGPGNPLGARAMYLGSTVYRIHGTNQPSTIGKFVSSGCIGMLNEDVSDLFDRVKVGTRVVVLPGGPPPGMATASVQPVPGSAAAGAGVPPAPISNGPVPGTQRTVVPPLPAPVTVRKREPQTPTSSRGTPRRASFVSAGVAGEVMQRRPGFRC